MKLIVGLGNPGREYQHSRHNAGFDALDKLASLVKTDIQKSQFSALIGSVRVGSQTILLMKPQTYMNRSGEAVIQAVNFYKIDPQDILVLHDDLDLPVGSVRIRPAGSSGGQKGMQNIMDHLHTEQVNRIRIGIDKNKLIPTVDYVLGKIPAEQFPAYEEALLQAAQAAQCFFRQPIEIVMNQYNRRACPKS